MASGTGLLIGTTVVIIILLVVMLSLYFTDTAPFNPAPQTLETAVYY